MNYPPRSSPVTRERLMQYAFEILFLMVIFLLFSTLVFENWRFSIVGTICFALLYKSLCREFLWPQHFQSSSFMRLAESGNLESLKTELLKGTISLQYRDQQDCTLLQYVYKSFQRFFPVNNSSKGLFSQILILFVSYELHKSFSSILITSEANL